MTVDVLVEVRIPHMGSVEHATLNVWRKSQGDVVAVDDVVCDISTDKVETEVNAPAAGRLVRFLINPGDEVTPGTPIALIADVSAAASDLEAALAAYGAGAVSQHTPETHGLQSAARAETEVLRPKDANGNGAVGQQPRPSPLVRRLARENRIDLTSIPGSGPGGRVMRDDIRRVLAAGNDWSAGSPSPASGLIAAAPALPAAPLGAPPPSPAVGGTSVPAGYEDVPHQAIAHSGRRRAIARNMTESWRIPTLTADVEVDGSALTDARATLNSIRSKAGQPKLSFLPFIIRATCVALADFPELNATYLDDRLLRWSTVNLGIAIDTADGLIVPVIRGADRLTVPALAEAMTDLAERARISKLTIQDLQGGTFTLSNPGAVGPSLRAEGILSPNQVGLLGLPGIVRRPIAVMSPAGEEYVAIRPILRPSFSFDHRAVDGATPVRFLTLLKKHLETWSVDAYR